MCAKPDLAPGETIGRSSSKDLVHHLWFLSKRSLALEADTRRDKQRANVRFQTNHPWGFSLHTKRLLQKVQSSARQRSLIWSLLGAQHLGLLAFIPWAYVPWDIMGCSCGGKPNHLVTCGCHRDWIQTIQAVKVDLHPFPHQETRENQSEKGIEYSKYSNSISRLPINPIWC